MSTLKVTYGRRDSQLEEAGNAYTQSLTISGSKQSTLASGVAAREGDTVLTVYADVDCYFAVGKTPNAEEAHARRFLPQGKEKRFALRAGQHVSVIQA